MARNGGSGGATITAGAMLTLKYHLDVLAAEYDYAAHLLRDPLRYVLEFDDARDVEVAGLFAACLAYGRVDRVLISVSAALARMGSSPADFVRGFDACGRAERNVFRGLVHRMTGAAELRALSAAVGAVMREYGSLEALFARGMSGRDETIRSGLQGVVEGIRDKAMAFSGQDPRGHRRIRFLLPSPAEGSACKRLNMWLRWMIRRQPGLDPGPWTSARAGQLVIPLDVHVVRLSRYFGLTSRNSADWKMAEGVTAVLRILDPEDPVKYDFALSHLGMAGTYMPAV